MFYQQYRVLTQLTLHPQKEELVVLHSHHEKSNEQEIPRRNKPICYDLLAKQHLQCRCINSSWGTRLCFGLLPARSTKQATKNNETNDKLEVKLITTNLVGRVKNLV